MDSIMGIVGAIDMILQSPGAGVDFSLMEEINGLLEKLLVFVEDFGIMDALGALGIF